MAEHMTVGDLLDALARYDRDRVVVTTNRVGSAHPVAVVRSVEPSGAVLIVEDIGGSFDIHNSEWREYAR